MLNLLHISDLHFGPPYVPEVGEALLQIIAELAPDALIMSGDFTQRAKRHQFEAAHAYLDRLPAIPRVAVPGNHDVPLLRIWERLWNPYGLYRQYIAEDLDTVLHLQDAVIIGLNSSRPCRAITNGRISTAQLQWCADVFADVPAERLRIVVAHHHFAPAPDYDHRSVMPTGKRALEVFTRLKVDLIMAGHQHRAYVGNSLDVYAGADREHGIIIVQCGTSTSRRGRAREREKNSFNWVQLTERSIRILHYMYFTQRGDFALTSQHEFARPSWGYLPKGTIPIVTEC